MHYSVDVIWEMGEANCIRHCNWPRTLPEAQHVRPLSASGFCGLLATRNPRAQESPWPRSASSHINSMWSTS